MRVTRPLFFLFVISFCFPIFSFAQSSIYQDAKDLAKYLEDKDWTIYVELQKNESSFTEINISNSKGDALQPYIKNKFSISSYGKFKAKISPPNPLDTILIFLGDTLISKFVTQDSFEIYNSPTEWKVDLSTHFFTDMVVDTILTIQQLELVIIDSFGQEIKTIIPDTIENYNASMLGGSSFGEIYGLKKDENNARKVLNILSSHADFKDVDKTIELSFQQVQSQYANNPFLNNVNIESPLLNSNADGFFPPNFLLDVNKNFSKQYYESYPWHKLLYGDSILQFQKTVSFKDASSSYRNRIVSSQKELTEASIRINETNQRKNLLDAKTVAVGLSDFIAERAQEELNLTFFNRFKENLKEPSELTILFENTKNLLYQFEISNYKTLLSHAREAFTADLEDLGLNFPEILKLKKYQKLNNSPEVFNLALIYYIADLAYKEQPVENILVAGFRKLEDRKVELNKSINIQLADSFLGKRNSNDKSSPVTNAPKSELKQLQLYLDQYFKATELSQGKLNQNYDALKQMFLPSVTYGITLGSNHNAIPPREFHNITRRAPTEAITSLERNLSRRIIYKNKIAYESSILEFYKKTISANLDGKTYYGYVLNNPEITDYDLYFKSETDSVNSIIAEGIEGARLLLDENIEDQLKLTLDVLKSNAAYNRIALKKHLQEKLDENNPKSKIKDFAERSVLLKKAINREIIFWENTTSLDSTDQPIAGLYFLKALIDNDEYIQLFHQVHKELSQNLLSFDELVNEYYKVSLGEKFDINLQSALDRLDYIQATLNDRTQALANKFSTSNLNDSVIQRKILESHLHFDTSAINETQTLSIDQEKAYLYKKFQIRASLNPDHDENNRIDIKLSGGPTAAKVEMHPTTLELRTVISQLNRLQQKLKEATNEDEKKNINLIIRKFNNDRDTLEIKLDELSTQLNEELDKEYFIDNDKKEADKKNIIAKYQENLNKLSNTTSAQPTFLKDAYSLDNNSFYQKYLEKKNKTVQTKFPELQELDAIDLQIQQTENALDSLNAISQKINNHISFLENKYCEKLVDAQQNASNLAKGFEVAAHLLFAFRDYKRVYDTLYVADSIHMTISSEILDTTTGFTNIITSDSLRVVKKPIDGTTEKLTAARWITRKEFDTLRKNEQEWNIFLGLLYQRLSTIEDAPNFSADGIAILATKFLSITHEMDTYRTDLRRKKAVSPDQISFKDYYPFIRSTVDIFNTVITTPSLGDTTLTVSKEYGLENIPVISNEALSLYENIYIQEYGNAVLNAMELLKIISAQKLSKKEARKSQRSINAVLTYGTFMANMINAQSSDQVKNILRSATLPPGSSRIKRETVSSFTINSYLGAAVGRDRLLNVPDNLDLDQDALGVSLSVPIGFTYSFSPNILKNNSSFSLHVPLIDLGAITAYRQNPDNANYSIDNLPDFSWNNLFSPGAFVVYNFANSPFSLGVGGQYGPQLREIKLNTGEAINVNSWRFPMAFFTIDVPFFNLHTGARKIIVD